MDSLVIPPAFRFGLPAGAVYISDDEHLRLSVLNAAAGVRLAIEARFMAMDGSVQTIRAELAPTSDRVLSQTIAGLRDGWLIHGHVRPLSGGVRVGQCYARVEVVRGRTGDVQPVATLAQGYVTDSSWLAWPAADSRDSTEGRGCIRSITGTDPAAGAEISETVPTNARWNLIALFALIVTDATVANRIPGLILDDGTNVFYQVGTNVSTAASTTGRYAWASGNGAFGETASNKIGTLPVPMTLLGGYRIRTSTGSIQAGDNWGAPQLLVEEWIED